MENLLPSRGSPELAQYCAFKTAKSSYGEKDEAERRPSPQRIFLVDLPDEILDDIFGYFCIHCRDDIFEMRIFISNWYDSFRERRKDRLALRSLCLTSKRLRNIAQPILYHVFPVAPSGPLLPSEDYAWPQRPGPFEKTIIKHSDLATAVRHVHTVIRDLRFDDYRDGRSLTGGEVDAYTLRWRPTPSHLAALARILAGLPNLQRITVTRSMWQSRALVRQAMQSAGVRQLSIRTLDLFNPWGDWGAMGNVLVELAAESLRELNVESMSTWSMWKWELPKKLERLECLRIRGELRPQADDLGIVLELLGCERLVTFTHHATLTSGCSDMYLTPRAARLLQRNRHTLRSLMLNFSFSDPSWEPVSFMSYLDLPSFSVLENVFLNAFSLFRWSEEDVSHHDPDNDKDKDVLTQLLPTSLISLRLLNRVLHGDPRKQLEERLLRALWGLVDALARGKFPNLRRVWYNITNNGPAWTALIREFAACGVEFGLGRSHWIRAWG
ncbi:hypothetical protein VTJ04DRAFT_2027 [Mycothermus thermophilus]|uniref:uncharacterized protein n=1 Tax=Humicola insolens TaxID=85995 RepID=UPI003742420E